jgi:hypothetical protein
VNRWERLLCQVHIPNNCASYGGTYLEVHLIYGPSTIYRFVTHHRQRAVRSGVAGCISPPLLLSVIRGRQFAFYTAACGPRAAVCRSWSRQLSPLPATQRIPRPRVTCVTHLCLRRLFVGPSFWFFAAALSRSTTLPRYWVSFCKRALCACQRVTSVVHQGKTCSEYKQPVHELCNDTGSLCGALCACRRGMVSMRRKAYGPIH